MIQMVVKAACIPELHEPMELMWIEEDGRGRKLKSVTRTTNPGFWKSPSHGRAYLAVPPELKTLQGHFTYVLPMILMENLVAL